MAAPFVQGRLRRERLSVKIETECGHCAIPMSITVDSDLNSQVNSEGAVPLVFEPEVNWDGFTEPNIINAY
jgi:hypothetical protein